MEALACEPAGMHRGRSMPGCARLRVALAAVVACLFIALAPAARSQALADEFVETWTTSDGLPHMTVHGIGQTSDGYLWLATWEGIARYNGHDFRLFRRDDVPGLREDSVRAMHVGPRGDLWVGSTRGGIVRWQGGRWVQHPGVEGLVTDLLEEPDGTLWVATARSGVIRFAPGHARTGFTAAQGLPSTTVNALARDPRGRIWVATSHGLARIDGPRALPVPLDGRTGQPVFALATDRAGRVLVGTEAGVLVGEERGFAPLHAGLVPHSITRIRVDADATLWVGTNNRGLARVRGGALEWLDSRGSLPNDRVLALQHDAEGALWVGTNGGLVRVRHAPIKTYTRRDGLADDFVRTTLVARDGRVWIGGGRGLDRFDPATRRFTHIGLGDAGSDASVLSLAEDASGDILVGTFHHGLIRLRGERVVDAVSMENGLPSNEVRAVVAAPDGTVWLGTKQGVVTVGAGMPRIYGVRQGLPADYVQALHLDDAGTLWVGTGLGAARVSKGVARPVDLGASEAHYIYDFQADAKGGTWIATDRGLVRVDRAGRATAHVGRAHGLPFEKIFALLADRAGRLWLTGNEGVAGIDAAQLDAVAAGTAKRLDVRLYGGADGMLSPQANGGSMPTAALDRQGGIWIATALGAARLDPASTVDAATRLPPIAIEHFEVDGRLLDHRTSPALAAGDHRFVVRFVAPTLLHAQRVRYRYRLAGMDRDWVELGGAREIQFTHLHPVAFRLHIEAYVPGRPVSAAGTVDFSIAPIWWQRPIAWIALASFALLVLCAAFLARTRQLRRNEARLRALVEESTAALRIQTRVAENLARTDALTGLANRRALDQAIERELAELAQAHSLCLVLLDIDGFKPINDLFGHAAGDLALQAVSSVLRRHARSQDIAARWGGDEFALLLVDCTIEQGLAVAERLRDSIERIDCSAFAPGLGISASIGVACTRHRHGRADLRTLVPRADEAVYRSKRGGCNRVSAALEPQVANLH